MNANRVKEKFISVLKERGGGVLGLVHAFKEIDLDQSGSLSWEEFNNALQRGGLNPSPQDVRVVFVDMDKDGNNEISFDEFLDALRGELSEKRRKIITKIFQGIDNDGDGIISMTDIGSCFNPKNHPDVKNGKKPVPVLLKEFFESFKTVTETGNVNLQQLLQYYANAAAFQDDQTFEQEMSSLWNITKGSGGAKSLSQTISNNNNRNTNNNNNNASGLSAVDKLLDQFKETLVSRGANGIIGLQRKFKIIDDDGNNQLNYNEFKKAIRENALTFSDTDLSLLFNYFDKDRSGTLSIDEFLVGVRVSLITIINFLSYFIMLLGCIESSKTRNGSISF